MNQNQKTSPLSVFRYLRNFCGISMEALAEAVGVSYLTVFNMEHNGNFVCISFDILWMKSLSER